jgi:small GTP-binding protein
MANDLTQAKRLIQECLETQSTYLDLGHCGITKLDDLPELFQCTQLETLILSNKWYDATSDRYIDSNNKGVENLLQSIPKGLQALENMRVLKAGGYYERWQLSDINFLKELKQLNSLDLSHNQISDISFLKELKQLNELYLSSNQISDISFLKELKQLNELYLSDNQISDISFLKELKQLNELSLSSNQISDISFLKELKQLNELSLYSNQISDISFLKELKQLKSLNLHSNQISDISFLKELKQLNSLYLSSNQIEFIPEFVFHLNNSGFIVDVIKQENPIVNPPLETLSQGKDAVLEWFKAEKGKFNEIKVILIGEPDAGKTSLLKRLKNNDFDPNESQTDGINIVDVDFGESTTFTNQTALHGFKGRFWDFGGQEIMSATHSMFLSNRSVYILLLQARDDKANEKQVRNWIKQIKATGGDSPIIIVANKIDVNPSFDFENIYSIQKDHKQVKDFIKISCADKTNLDKLKNKIAEIIPTSGFFKTEVDVRYIQLKELIKEQTKGSDYFNEQTFKKLCKSAKITSKEIQKFAIDFLDKIGIASHFDKIEILDYYVLDPNWVTTGLYRIITSKKAADNDGRLRIEDLDTILNEERKKVGKEYNPFTKKDFKYDLKAERSFIAEVLFRYKLAFKFNDDEFIIPALLNANPKKELLEEFDQQKTLGFIYKYDSMPKHISSELLVELHKYENLAVYWRNGGVVKLRETKALIQAGNDMLSIKIIIGENTIDIRDLMMHIRAIIEIINKKLPFQPERLIPLPDEESEYVLYEKLLTRLKKGKKTYIHKEDTPEEKEYDIGELLHDIPSKMDIEKMILKLDEKTDEMMSQLKKNHEQIMSFIKEIREEDMKDILAEMYSLISNAFEAHQEVLDDQFKEQYHQLNDTEEVSRKLELSIPLIKMLGINYKVEVDVKKWVQRMQKKYGYKLFEYFEYR